MEADRLRSAFFINIRIIWTNAKNATCIAVFAFVESVGLEPLLRPVGLTDGPLSLVARARFELTQIRRIIPCYSLSESGSVPVLVVGSSAASLCALPCESIPRYDASVSSLGSP